MEGGLTRKVYAPARWGHETLTLISAHFKLKFIPSAIKMAYIPLKELMSRMHSSLFPTCTVQISIYFLKGHGPIWLGVATRILDIAIFHCTFWGVKYYLVATAFVPDQVSTTRCSQTVLVRMWIIGQKWWPQSSPTPILFPFFWMVVSDFKIS